MQREEILKLIDEELIRAESKWPDYYSDIIHASGLINEEAGETMAASLDYTYDNGSIDEVVSKTIQTAAMCFRLLQNLRKLKAVQSFVESGGKQLTIDNGI